MPEKTWVETLPYPKGLLKLLPGAGAIGSGVVD
jgi:hypothetical protein